MNLNVNDIFHIKDEDNFNQVALEIFRYQYEHIQVYQEFVNHLKIDPSKIEHYTSIPFLPIECFKKHRISDHEEEDVIYFSSGTTGMTPSKHFVADQEVYQTSFRKAFEYFYGDISDYCIIGLLPSYLEREGSSLIEMVDDLILRSKHPVSQFSLSVTPEIIEIMKNPNQKCLVLGVTYAILDLAEQFPDDYPNTIFMETGGMKGTRKELTKSQIHEFLIPKLNITEVHSEYGMTELLSQAYSSGHGIFKCPPWMKVLTREVDDPLTLQSINKTGGINVIDLANIHSCSFIATQDLGKIKSDQSFEILGRFDHSDVRGCNLLIQ